MTYIKINVGIIKREGAPTYIEHREERGRPSFMVRLLWLKIN
jgi:hypothetical protein